MKQAVVIIGAGAGGLALALTLSQFGIKPIVIDNNFYLLNDNSSKKNRRSL